MSRAYTDEQKARNRERVRAWKRANRHRVKAFATPELQAEYNREYREKNRERISEQRKAAYAANADERRKKSNDYYHANRDVMLERQRDYCARNSARNVARATAWQKANPEKASAQRAASNALRLKRHPPWVDRRACKAFYDIAVRASACTGIKFEVDHIYPLRGKLCSGLHVPWNLRVIPRAANRRKANKVLEAAP